MTLTAITIGLFVVAPAKFDAANPEARVLAAAKRTTIAATEVAISPARIDVIGIRDPELAAAQLDRPGITPVATR